MPIVVPKIDDLNYDEIFAETLARIPVHNPEWTNFNDSDPGITILQLFAFMTENLLYRCNLIPERNRKKFLKLLGIPMQAPSPAQGIVTFSNPRGPLKTMTISSGLEVLAGQLPFQTLNGLDVMPIEAYVYYKKPVPEDRKEEIKKVYEMLYESFKDSENELNYYETKSLDPPLSGSAFPVLELSSEKDTIDKSLWIALLARSKDLLDITREEISNKVLTLGILPGLMDVNRVLSYFGMSSSETQGNLLYQIPVGDIFSTETETRVPRYKTLDASPYGDPLSEPSTVQLQLPDSNELKLWKNLEPLEMGTGDFPPSLEDANIEDRIITWIRISLQKSQAQTNTISQLSAKISWVGINAARITQCAHVLSENLGRGTGEPDQKLTLANTPVVVESVKLTVNGEQWNRTDDLMSADSEVPVRTPRLVPTASLPPSDKEKAKVFTVDRESGEICFGNGIHGTRPPSGSVIHASYDYGGGISGNVGIGAINKGPGLPAGLKVTNPLPAWGGDQGESIEEAERNIPLYIRHRDRLVSTKDFEDITWRTPGIDLGRVEVLPSLHPDLYDIPSEGVVTVMVIPRYDPLQPEAPVPDRLFLEMVCRHLNPRRIITTELHVRGPKYIDIWVSIGIEVIPGRDIAPVREEVKKTVRKFLSSLTGGFEGKGWPLEKVIENLEIWAVATRVEGVSKINSVILTDSTGVNKDRIPIRGLELPRLMGLAVQYGEPQDIADLIAVPPEQVSTVVSKKILPVPVILPECK
ncbi:MAG: putative baseplate assembly protein [bacterium]